MINSTVSNINMDLTILHFCVFFVYLHVSSLKLIFI